MRTLFSTTGRAQLRSNSRSDCCLSSVAWSNGSGAPGTSFELAGSLISGQFLDNGPRALARRRRADHQTAHQSPDPIHR